MRTTGWVGTSLRWVLAATATGLTGCGGGFFIDTTSTGSTAAATGDYIYVANSATNSLSAFSVGSSALTLISGSPYALGFAPNSVAVSRANTFVYVAGGSQINAYTIGTGGVLTADTAGNIATTVSTSFAALETSIDGNWLFALDAALQAVNVYSINLNTGALALKSSVPLGLAAITLTAANTHLRISPSGTLLGLALGVGGDEAFSFNTSTGALALVSAVTPNAAYNDNSVVFDSTSSYMFVARNVIGATSGFVVPYTISSSGVLAASSAASVATGQTPFDLLLDSTGTYLYVANRGSSTVSNSGTVTGYTLTSGGTLTALASSPFASGQGATALAEDNSKKFFIAASTFTQVTGTSDLTLYGLDVLTAGRLDPVGLAVSGTDPAGALAVAATH